MKGSDNGNLLIPVYLQGKGFHFFVQKMIVCWFFRKEAERFSNDIMLQELTLIYVMIYTIYGD